MKTRLCILMASAAFICLDSSGHETADQRWLSFISHQCWVLKCWVLLLHVMTSAHGTWENCPCWKVMWWKSTRRWALMAGGEEKSMAGYVLFSLLGAYAHSEGVGANATLEKSLDYFVAFTPKISSFGTPLWSKENVLSMMMAYIKITWASFMTFPFGTGLSSLTHPSFSPYISEHKFYCCIQFL